MKITFSNNISDESVNIETNKDEVGGAKELKKLALKFTDEMQRAYDAAHMVWENFPEFKQVTLDTMTDEERDFITQVENSKNKN